MAITPKNAKELTGLSYPKLLAIAGALFVSGGIGGFELHRQYANYGANFDGITHTIERVPDGDTLITESGIGVRILGLDAPELDQCYGPEAKVALEELVLGKRIRFVKDVTAEDRFDRLLRYVYVMSDHPEEDNIHVSEYMVKNGFGRYYSSAPDKLFQALLTNAQGEARNAGRGLHGACEQETDIVSQPSPDCNIKGNVADGTKKKSYFYPGCPNYATVKVERSKGERYFCSESEARDAGYVPAWRCPTR